MDPRLGLIQDENLRNQLQKKSFWDGIGQMGLGLLQQSGYQPVKPTLGEAIGHAGPMFQQGVDKTISHGLLVDETRRKQMEEERKKKALEGLGENAYNKYLYQLGNEMGDVNTMASAFTGPSASGAISKVNPKDFTPDSVQRFAQSNNFADLVLNDGSGVSLLNAINSHAGRLFGGLYNPITQQFSLGKEDAQNAQAIATEAMRLIRTGQATQDDAVTLAARKLNIDIDDLSQVPLGSTLQGVTKQNEENYVNSIHGSTR